LDLNNDYTHSTGMHHVSSSGSGHVIDNTRLPRSLFSDNDIHIRHVFGNSFGERMGEDEVKFTLLLVCLNAYLCTID
jgi:hypothetical protein